MLNIIITSMGDPSVGIPDSYWEINDVDFEELDREQFRAGLETAFAFVADPVKVQFSDELPPTINPEFP